MAASGPLVGTGDIGTNQTAATAAAATAEAAGALSPTENCFAPMTDLATSVHKEEEERCPVSVVEQPPSNLTTTTITVTPSARVSTASPGSSAAAEAAAAAGNEVEVTPPDNGSTNEDLVAATPETVTPSDGGGANSSAAPPHSSTLLSQKISSKRGAGGGGGGPYFTSLHGFRGFHLIDYQLDKIGSGSSSSSSNNNNNSANNRSPSMASVSSEGSNGSHVVDRSEMISLTADVRIFKEAFGEFRVIFEECRGGPKEALRVLFHERLGPCLTILQAMMTRYPILQAADLIDAAGLLIEQSHEAVLEESVFESAMDRLAMCFSARVSQYLTGDPNAPSEALSPEQTDALLMRHDQGVDAALECAKTWTKYAADILSYVEKRTTLQLEMARKLTKLAQTTRPILKEESYLPFQSIYCTALDQDLEICASTSATCSLIQAYKFLEPLQKQITSSKKCIKRLENKWNKELKTMQESVSLLDKSKAAYALKSDDQERCREAVRIAEQGAELGATAENKVDKRKRMSEEADQKSTEAEAFYHSTVMKANEQHRKLMKTKSEIVKQVRVLISESDQVMKTVTLNYFQYQQTLSQPISVQYATLTEGCRKYEPGSQYMEFVRCRIGDQSSRLAISNPFNFEPRAEHMIIDPLVFFDKNRQRKSDPTMNSDYATSGTYKFRGDHHRGMTTSASAGGVSSSSSGVGGTGAAGGEGPSGPPILAWASAMAPIEPSDTDSFESKDSGKSRDTSPTASPWLTLAQTTATTATEDNVDGGDPNLLLLGGGGGSSSSNATSGGDPGSSSSFPSGERSVSLVSGSGLGGSLLPGGPSTLGYGSLQPPPPPHGQVTAQQQQQKQTVSFSLAARTHRMKKVTTPSKCQECENFYLQGFTCQDCGLSAHKKCLEVLALNCPRKRLPRKIPAMGIDLGTYLLDSGAQVPPLLCKCVHEIDQRGINVKGIYRVCGAKRRIDRISAAFDVAPELVELSDIHPNVIANVLKKYMQKLPEPLLTFGLYQDFIRVARSYPSNHTTADPSATAAAAAAAANNNEDESVIPELTELVRKLPRHHYHTVGFLMHHLNRVAANSEVNNMPASNLAIVFGPTLMRAADGSASLSFLVETEHQTRCIEMLTIHATAIFGPPESVLPRDYAKYTTSRGVPATVSKLSTVSDSGGGNIHHGVNHPGSGSSRPSGSRNQDSSSSSAGDLVSSQTERHSVEQQDYFPIPGHISGGGNEDLSEDDEDAEAIPSCWLPDDSAKTKKSPLLIRGASTPPKIIKASLKSFSGLEGVTPERLSTQDSLEASQRLSKQPSSEVMATSRKSVPHDASSSAIPHVTRHHHRASDAHFAKMGKAAKKHSLDEEYLSPPLSASASHPPLSERLSSEIAGFGGSRSASSHNNHQTLQHSMTTDATTASCSSTLNAAPSPPMAIPSSTTKDPQSPSPATAAAADQVDSGGAVAAASLVPQPPASSSSTVSSTGASATGVMRSSTSPGSGRSSLTIGIGIATSGNNASSGRSSSLSDDQAIVSGTTAPPGAHVAAAAAAAASSSSSSNTSGSNNAASSSSTVAEQRRKFLASSAATVSTDSHHFPPVTSPHSKMSSSLPTSASTSIPPSSSVVISNLEENKVKIQVSGGHATISSSKSQVVKQASVDKGTCV